MGLRKKFCPFGIIVYLPVMIKPKTMLHFHFRSVAMRFMAILITTCCYFAFSVNFVPIITIFFFKDCTKGIALDQSSSN